MGDGAVTWWWVRHAPIPGPPGVIHGQSDVDCDTRDSLAFQALALLLPRNALWLTTPLQRTHQTLAAIAAASPSPEPPPAADTEPAFAEQSFGAWQGLDWNGMQSRDPGAYAAFWADPTHNTTPGGESFAQVMQRVAAAIEHRSARHPGRTIVAIAHGGSIRAAIAHALALSPQVAMAITIDNLSVTRLTRLPDGVLRGTGSRWRVEIINAPCRWISSTASC